jgi:hypothetical protein
MSDYGDDERTAEVEIETEHYSTIMEELYAQLGDDLDAIVTRSGDRIGRQVRLSGELTIEDVGPGRKQRRRQRARQRREQARERHALAEGAEAVIDA